jgi:hypothetical protein
MSNGTKPMQQSRLYFRTVDLRIVRETTYIKQYNLFSERYLEIYIFSLISEYFLLIIAFIFT